MKPSLKALLKARRADLKRAEPKSRDHVRRKVKVLEMVALLRRQANEAA